MATEITTDTTGYTAQQLDAAIPSRYLHGFEEIDGRIVAANASLASAAAQWIDAQRPTTHTAKAAATATDRQVSYIMSLLARRNADGTGDGFMAGPTTRADVARMTRADASAYIDSLTGRY